MPPYAKVSSATPNGIDGLSAKAGAVDTGTACPTVPCDRRELLLAWLGPSSFAFRLTLCEFGENQFLIEIYSLLELLQAKPRGICLSPEAEFAVPNPAANHVADGDG